MSLLRIRGSTEDAPARCQWALVNDGSEPVTGEGLLADLPRRARRVQLMLPAAQVLITRARLPRAARRHSSSVLAYAVEDKTVGDPVASQVSWLGTAGDADVLAVVDRDALKRWLAALDTAGFSGVEVQSETLLLPWAPGEWSLAWNGREGFVRSGSFEGAATDCGDRDSPPLSLQLMLEEALAHGAVPASIALYATERGAAPDHSAWTRALGVPVRLAGHWDWRAAPPGAGVVLTQERRPWRSLSGMATRLRPAAWLLGAALAIHAAALVIDWASLAAERRNLQAQMESRFRATFPDAVAVTDPALQMRRKLAEARHAAGQADGGDLVPMIELMAPGLKELPPGALRTVSYESGRMSLEFSGVDAAVVRRTATRLIEAGLLVEIMGASILTVRAL